MKDLFLLGRDPDDDFEDDFDEDFDLDLDDDDWWVERFDACKARRLA